MIVVFYFGPGVLVTLEHGLFLLGVHSMHDFHFTRWPNVLLNDFCIDCFVKTADSRKFRVNPLK
jgi:hypothetical protein